jgi:hypothetical protein
LQDQARIQAHLCTAGETAAVGSVVERTECVAIAASVLVIALAGRNERQGRNVAADQIGVQAARTVEADDIVQTIRPRGSFLNTLEVSEGIVLHGIGSHDARRS